MSRPVGSVKTPSYCHHKATDRAYVTIGGKPEYLGRFGSRGSRQEYDRVVGEYLAAGRQTVAGSPADGVTIARLIAQFWKHARAYYRTPDGAGVSQEAQNYRDALKPALKLYGRTAAAEFGPLALRVVREEMIKLGWARTYINRQCLRIKHVFRWAVGHEMLPASVYESLRAVEGLVAGKCKAKETEAVKPVAEDHADAVLDFLSPQIRAMIELQALTGMRPAEVCAMRGCDLDTTGARWAYKPEQHKTKHRGHDRVIPLGPLARDIVAKFLGTDLRAHLFNPSEAAEARRQLHHEQRKTPENQGNNIGTNRKRRPRIAPGERFLVDAYRRAISRACDRAFLPPDHLAKQKDESVAAWKKRLTDEQHAELRAWRRAHRFHPHQLRHTFATKVRAQYGPDVALTLLGDRTTRMVDVYAAKDHATAVQVAEKIG